MKEEKPDLQLSCPYCRRSLSRYLGSNLEAIGNSCYRGHMMGHCPKCGKLFAWTEEYRIYLATEPKEVTF